jgi:hypothetical protein
VTITDERGERHSLDVQAESAARHVIAEPTTAADRHDRVRSRCGCERL